MIELMQEILIDIISTLPFLIPFVLIVNLVSDMLFGR